MKQILFLLMLATISQAQTITKSYVLGNDGTNYFEVTTITQDDESATSTKALIGPVSAIASDQADKIEAQMAALATKAYEISKINSRLSEVRKADTTITTLTTVSPLKIIQARHSELLLPGWTIDQAGAGFVPLVFTINGANNLRYSINGASTKSATIYGNIITLSSFPAAGSNTEFYLDEKGTKFFSLPNRTAVIKKP